ncbi:ATP-binding cassette domain-containing protein [Halobacteria archaeon AArc-m2/3/4]|uniref:ATP-binding cassette domain-containing protein n=1 Tax=Natronoglomus mannanivorans TaxID=2979990 RepID=A0ABT2QKC4_9EURY|nr:ATP-binding cassette domain-containing protein [Halobacteria archaeon AArc-m2/3/4]
MSERAARVEQPDERGDPLVVVDELRSYYESERLLGGKPVKAVDGVSFEIRRGETLGIVGESGCGKTTLGRTLVRLEEATDGTVRYDGTDVTTLSGTELKRWRKNAQLVFQDPTASLNERQTVGAVIREPLEAHSWGDPHSRRERVYDLLELVGLAPEHYYRYPHQFSGGQKQRIGIARALALEPDFLVLDEPVSALDVSVQAKILNLLSDLQAELDLTYLLIAHDLSVVRHVCDRVGVMYLGKLMELGPSEELFSDPANPYTQSLLSAIPKPDPSAPFQRLPLRGTPPSPRDPPSGCVFSTRCPLKIRPDIEGNHDLSRAQWEAIDRFREVLRERDLADVTFVERLRERLGLSTRFTPIPTVAEELLGDVSFPDSVEAALSRAVDRAAEGEVSAARAELADALGGVCEREQPVRHDVGEGHSSRCHRHLEAYADADDVLEGEDGVGGVLEGL